MAGVAETLETNPMPGSSDKRESLRTNESNGKCQIKSGAESKRKDGTIMLKFEISDQTSTL